MSETPSPRRRRRVILALVVVLALGASAGYAWYLLYGQWYESTENAYLTGNLVVVSSQVSGTVVWIGAEENEPVRAGQEILRLGDGDALQNLELRKQELALAVREVLALRSEVERLRAELESGRITHDLAVDEFQRRERLFEKKMVSEEELDAARTREQETSVALRTADHALDEARIRAGTQPVAEHPLVRAAAAQLRTAFRDWRKTRVVAPVSGEVARRRVQAGQRVETGMALFSIAERGSAWIEANFKENQLRHLRPDQPVTIRSDLYGEELELHGRVESIGTGTGAVFSLLPPQNATGNWIKIVQRVPVRIALETSDDRDHPLPFGASFHVRVDTHDRSGPRLVERPRSQPVAHANVYDYQDEGAETLIASIIEASLGT